ncbi:nucleoside hydrolase [Streptomyces sp. CA-106110]|uniref:nucleoside hydrolase n=1 Tax=Streptomyces sp. CA-106110 TaxID=3240044 RepID=UPI003D8A178E
MKNLILDVDTGVDDALALLFAVRHPGLRLRAVTCVAGNTHVDAVVRNTLTVLDAAGVDVPVARGAERPLLSAPHDATHFHGQDGLADLGLPAPSGQPVGVHAVELMRREILTSPDPVTLVPLAPMTNIALLLRTYPEVTENLEHIVFMGGSAGFGNATPVAEFNVWHDPEAAAIVLGSGVPTTMYGLDVSYEVAVSGEDIEKLILRENHVPRLAGRLLRHLTVSGAGEARIPVAGGASIGDAGAVCAVADPAGLSTRTLPVEVCLADGPARGQTIVDHRTSNGDIDLSGRDGGPHAKVAMGVDRERYRQLFLNTVCGAADDAACGLPAGAAASRM